MKMETEAKQQSAIEKLVRDFFGAGDRQDSELFLQSTHSQFRVVASDYPAPGQTSVIGRDDFAQLLQNRKLGGEPRNIEFRSIESIGDNAANVRVHLAGASLEFDNTMSLVREDGEFKVIQDHARIAPRKA